MRVEDMIPINDSMPEEQLMAIMILKESFDEKAGWKKLRLCVMRICHDSIYRRCIAEEDVQGVLEHCHGSVYGGHFATFKTATKRGPDSIYRRCIAEEDVQGVLEHCHGSVYGGHFATFKTATKVLQSGLWWPTLFKDAADYIAKCDPCQRKGGITKTDEMPLNPILPVQERTRQHLQEMHC
ncbi:unnamed protein product [Microthlaspi erraticum]|uniref:Integrase zinc-binding domain-containing protein n=1 Tax=Microthlaspi erraticum TaxID=1685480 RepID=A0A6D2J4V7_9BRAS|nr:unnamed protein product [Microthlaspi erraticum]